MPKAYWVSAYRAVKDVDKLTAYAKLAGPALTAGGGRFLARGEPTKVYEHGLKQRTVLIEFDSVEQAVAAHDSPATRPRWTLWATAPNGKSASSKASEFHRVRARRATRQFDPLMLCSQERWLSPQVECRW
jgi:uncharacterized protein (DUF1330 family)